MENIFLERYAQLLVNYSLSIKPGEKLFIQTTPLAEPLVREVYKAALRAGAAVVEIDFLFEGKQDIFLQNANKMQLAEAPPLYKLAMETFDAYLHIRAPFVDSDKFRSDVDTRKNAKLRQKALQPIYEIYNERTGTRALKRCLCQYPTKVCATAAKMSLKNYTEFILNACGLTTENATNVWLGVRRAQQHVVDYLNQRSEMRYLNTNSKTDISFNTLHRIWINSDGQTNMPSGEVYTAPIEDSVNGKIFFTVPTFWSGQKITGVQLTVKNGFVEKWSAKTNEKYLDALFAHDGARYFGEAAIGTNMRIQQQTNNILFDEKIGGTIHMAVGQSYAQCGGKNQSNIHHDMMTNMRNGGEIFADGVCIYRDGIFLI